jgi:hypothetical protein
MHGAVPPFPIRLHGRGVQLSTGITLVFVFAFSRNLWGAVALPSCRQMNATLSLSLPRRVIVATAPRRRAYLCCTLMQNATSPCVSEPRREGRAAVMLTRRPTSCDPGH